MPNLKENAMKIAKNGEKSERRLASYAVLHNNKKNPSLLRRIVVVATGLEPVTPSM